jgi:curved DNA-binding protein CbpA
VLIKSVATASSGEFVLETIAFMRHRDATRGAMRNPDYYETLEVSQSATGDEIKKAYRRLVRRYHPDRNPGDKAAEAHIKEVNEAYGVLSDPEKRREYDSIGQGQQDQAGDDYEGDDYEDESGWPPPAMNDRSPQDVPWPPMWSAEPTSPPMSTPNSRRTPVLAGIIAIVLVCSVCVLLICVLLITAISAIGSSDFSAGVGPSTPRYSSQDIDDARQDLADVVVTLNEDVSLLARDTDFQADLNAYAKDWAQMQTDYQTELDDYRIGCGSDGYGAFTVSYDASRVSYDLSSIQYDDSGLAYTIGPLADERATVESDVTTVQSALQKLQGMLDGNSSASTSVASTISDAETGLTNARQEVTKSASKQQQAQAQATNYDQRAAQLNDAAQHLANSMTC